MQLLSKGILLYKFTTTTVLAFHEIQIHFPTKMPLPPTSSCQVCGPRAPESLFKCSRYQCVLYCGREHQSAHFAEHKSLCKRVLKIRNLMETEASKVRNSIEDDWTPANAFETHVGHFWGLRNTRPYMTAKLEVIRALSSIASRPAIEAALAEANDAMRLCRTDNLGIREVVPTLLLLLNRFQEAYDFIKWYATSGNDPHYDWGNMDLPFLDVRDADMAEEMPSPMTQDRNVFFMSNLLFIKLHLAKTVQDELSAKAVANRADLPVGVTDSLGAFLAPKGKARSSAELKKLHKKLMGQVDQAFAFSHFQNQHFWNALLDPTPVVMAPKPLQYEPGDVNQVKLWVLQNAMLWRDHHEFIRERRSAYPEFLPEMPRRGPKMMHHFR